MYALMKAMLKSIPVAPMAEGPKPTSNSLLCESQLFRREELRKGVRSGNGSREGPKKDRRVGEVITCSQKTANGF